jgi:hypothetical protein
MPNFIWLTLWYLLDSHIFSVMSNKVNLFTFRQAAIIAAQVSTNNSRRKPASGRPAKRAAGMTFMQTL